MLPIALLVEACPFLLAVACRAVRVCSGQLAVQEQLLGLLVALVLRMPDIAAAAAEAGAIDVLTEVLQAAPCMAAEAKVAAAAAATAANGSSKAAAYGTDMGSGAAACDDQEVASRVFGVGVSGSNGNGGSAAAVQRQACMAVRNMVVRNPDLRPGFLAAGAEEQLRAVKVLFPGSCKDVASAALRDLGLDNYN